MNIETNFNSLKVDIEKSLKKNEIHMNFKYALIYFQSELIDQLGDVLNEESGELKSNFERFLEDHKTDLVFLTERKDYKIDGCSTNIALDLKELANEISSQKSRWDLARDVQDKLELLKDKYKIVCLDDKMEELQTFSHFFKTRNY